jgi:hypothetical protein
MTEPTGSPPEPESEFITRKNEAQEQPSLFPTEELIIPPGLLQMRKSVAAVYAVPLKVEHEHTLNTRRLFDACALIAQLDMRKRGRDEATRIVRERISPVFEVTAKALTSLAGIPGKNLQRVYDAMERLFEMELAWNILGDDAQVQWRWKAHLFSSLGIGQGASAGRIRFSMDPEILRLFLEPSIWANLSLQVMQHLPTPSAYALYQACFRFVTTEQKLTAALPVKTWIELLVGPSRYVKIGPDGKEVINYADFKRRTLLDAVERVNSVAALAYALELKEYTSGKKVTKLQFRFVPKQQQSLGLSLPTLWSQELLDVLSNVGFSETEIGELSQAYEREVVVDSLKRLAESEARRKAAGKPVLHRKEYLKGILANVSKGDDVAADEQLAAQVQAEHEQRLSDQRQARLKEAFAAHQAAQFQAGLGVMAPDTRSKLISDFETSDEGQKTQLLWRRRGWDRNAPAMAVLRGWMQRNRPEALDLLLPSPQDRNFESWMAWRLDEASRQ